MRILVVGGGGREHALCWAIVASPLCDRLYCAPGNAGIAREATCVPIGTEDVGGLLAFAREDGRRSARSGVDDTVARKDGSHAAA